MSPTPRSEIIALPPAIHGARDYAELNQLGLNPDDVIDFSTNSNPFGPHPNVIQAILNALARPTLARYPDRDCLALCDAIATADNVPAENILPGNGATELIHLIASTFVNPDSCHLILSPTFGEYARAIRMMGGNIYEHYPQTHTNLCLDVDDVTNIIRHVQPDSVWLCNPNNPTGQYWSTDQLAALHAADPEQNILWVIDEAYRHFVNQEQDSNLPELQASNIIRLRSLTKDYGLAGLRLGYLITDAELMAPLKTAQLPWSVNNLAQISGIATLQPDVIKWRQQTLRQLHQYAANLWAGLIDLGFTIVPTQTTFALIPVDNAQNFRQQLLQKGLLVRDCNSFGLPGYIRIAAHQPEANKRLLTAISSIS